jgi:hypothetical protein
VLVGHPYGFRSGHNPVSRSSPWVNAVDVNTAVDLTLIGALAGVWLAAGLLADTLPASRTALELRRRAVLLSTVIALGAAVLVAVPIVADLVPGQSAAPSAALLPAVPALFVLLVSVRRLTRVRQGAGAFVAAPHTPTPPALRAVAAHPLITTPVQVTGLAALVGLPIAAGFVRLPGASVAGILISVVGAAVLIIGIRAAIRHSRLSLLALAPIRSTRRTPVRTR